MPSQPKRHFRQPYGPPDTVLPTVSEQSDIPDGDQPAQPMGETPSQARDAMQFGSDDAAGRVFRELLRTDEEAPSPPPIIRGYRLLEPLGVGGQDTTWLAEREEARIGEARVAVKVLRYSMHGFPQHYWSELEALKNLHLECMPRILDSGISEGHPWFASELIDGLSVAELPSETTRSELIAILARAGDALSEIHRAGYVHRDIKPNNIMVRNRDGAVFIVDFGLSRRLSSRAKTDDATAATVGTPGYLSPEQARGLSATAASDQWSLAATAFLMLLDTTPHPSAANSDAQLALARTAAPRPAQSIDPTLPKAIARVLDRALAPNPRRRYSSCAAFATALRDADAGATFRRAIERHLPMLYAVSAALILGGGLSLHLFVPSWLWGVTPLPVGGDYPAAEFAQSIVTLGDFDADGIDEVAFGAPGCPARNTGEWIREAGSIYILSGTTLETAAQGGHTAPLHHELRGTTELGHMGRWIGAPGNVDGDSDGLPELATVVSAPDNLTQTLLVIRGSKNFANSGPTDLRQHATVSIPIDVKLGPLSTIVGRDLDGDGLNEIIVGETNAGEDREGRLLIVHGARDFFEKTPESHTVPPPPNVRGFGCCVQFVATEAKDGSAARVLAIIGAPLGISVLSPNGTPTAQAFRGQILVIDAKDLLASDTPRVLRAITAGRDHDWFGRDLDAAIIGDTLRIASGACAIAHAKDDSGRADLFEIPLTELDGSHPAIDLDDDADARYRLAHLQSPPVDANGKGDLCGSRAALVPGGWCVALPRNDEGGSNAGRIWLGPPGQERALDGEQRLELLGQSLAVWYLRGRAYVLAGAPFADYADILSPGAARVFKADFGPNAE